MPFETTTKGTVPFYRGTSSTGYDVGQRSFTVRRASIDLEEAKGVIADIITDYRHANNALIAHWREFYQLAQRWDGVGMLRLELPHGIVVEAMPILEGTLRRNVQDKHPKEDVVDQSLRWVVDTYNTDQETPV